MADVITRLKLESGEYDSKIKRAVTGLQQMENECRKVGGTLAVLEKDQLDYVKSLGQMQTVATSTRGKLNELTQAYTELRVQYNRLTDEEKKGDFGKALSSSLDQLKTRINNTKTELNSVNVELGNTKQAEQGTASGIEGLTSALGINIKTLAGWGTAIAAGKVALDVAKDAFFASESSVDEWGRTVAASQSLYEGFLTAINNGDISGYLSNIDSIVKAARLAYDELDKLGTMKTIQAPQISKQQTENERIRSMIQTGRYIAPQDGRRNAVFNGREMQTGDKLTAGQIRALEKQLQGGMQKMVQLVGNEVDQTGKAINAYYDKLAKTNGMSLQEFKKGTSSWEEFSKKMQGYEQYKEWDKQARTEFAKQGGRGNVDFDKSNPYAEFRKWGTFRVDKEGDNSYKDLVNLIQQRDQKVGQVYSTQAQAYRTMNRAEGVTVRQIMGGTGGKGGSGGTATNPVDQAEKIVSDALFSYQQSVDKAKLEMESGLKTEADMKKVLLSGQERLYDAYGKAYATYADPKYKEAQDKAAAEIVKLGGEVKNATEAQKKAEQAARELEAAQKKLAVDQSELAQARKNGNLKEIYAAEKKVTAAQQEVTRIETIKVNVEQGKVDLPNIPTDDETIKVNVEQGNVDLPSIPTDDETINVNIKATTDNVSAAIEQIKERLGGLEIGTLDFNAAKANIVDMTILQTLINAQIKNGLKIDPSVTQELFSQILNGGDIDDAVWQDFIDKINQKLKEMELEPIKIDFNTGSVKKESKEMAKDWQAAGNAIQAVGNAMQQIEDPATKVLGTIAQAVATMALSYAQAANSPAVTGTGWGWIAFAATGLATMISSISAIKQATAGFANGGVIPGNSMSGDNLRGITPDGTVYGLNSQEIILNRAQQGNLAAQLEGGGIGNLQLETKVGAEDLIFVLNNNASRRGFGEFIDD